MTLVLKKCHAWPAGLCSAPLLMIDAWLIEAKAHVNKLCLTRTAQCFVIRILQFEGIVTVYVSEIGM
jgi:hypothetical protein